MNYTKFIFILIFSHVISFALEISETQQSNQVMLAWSPNSEPDLSHYKIYRDTQSGTMVYLNTISRIDTIYTDTTVQPGITYYYKVTAVDFSNNESEPSNEVSTTTVTAIDKPSECIPAQYFLEQNYPNPFNPTTKIRFYLPKSSHVNIGIYDITGQLLVTLLNVHTMAGIHEVEFNAGDLPTGIYLYKILVGEYQEIRKMILMK